MTTKANGNDIDVFGVTFDPAGHLVVAETGINAVATYALNLDGTIALIDAVPTG